MKFSIITPTHKRADKLARAVASVLAQAHDDLEMIIVNDSPDDTCYAAFENTLSDSRIIYLKNEKNAGVNYSRNRALDSVAKDSDWIIFLDDDDYLAPDALATFRDLITAHPKTQWFAIDRAYADGTSVTHFPKTDTEYSYAWDYLITRRCKGDATHCISTALTRGIRFPTRIKQAEEWLFFYQLGLRTTLFYHDHNGTLTDGYDAAAGLNFRKQTRREQYKTLFAIIKEGRALRLGRHITFLIYIIMRLIRPLLK